ncbi:uncharacterized protein [Rutidosis leptorrhynchoides]|uniref:uncharacterized protein isoform X2 n=1 Tax=Rutidosis leptorrhynchoides TaxID=125765 RepID=UPI003A9A5A09
MDTHGSFSFDDKNKTMRKKRSNRVPRNKNQTETEKSSLSSSPSNNGSRGLSDDNVGGKVLNLSQCNSSRASYTNLNDAEKAPNFGSDFGTQENDDDKDTGADKTEVITSNYNKDIKYDNVVKRVKLKLGGVTRTIHAKPQQHSTGGNLKQNMTSQDNSDQDSLKSQDPGIGLCGIPWKDFSSSGFSVRKANSVRRNITEENIYDSDNNSKRVPKRRVLDDDDDDEDDAELRYLAKMKSKSVINDDDVDDEEDEGEGRSKKQRKITSVLRMDTRKKSKTGREYKDDEYTGEEREYSDTVGEDSSREMSVTTRRQALQSGRDLSTDSSVVEFPHGLPPAPPRKQKDKLSEVEYQLKKAEAAERRRIQAAKAARESEAEAIRKILGQDSSRKKRENKMKQKQDALAQERNLNTATLSSNTVRWVIRPTGTIVTFSDDIGLPNIFDSKSSSYPPPREPCAGPSCSKPFKYRDSRSKLPLCSLLCYKAVQETPQTRSVK